MKSLGDAMLQIIDLSVSIEGKQILKDLNLEIGPGEVHALMGPNGSGKSTLVHTIAGRESFEVTGGTILFQGQSVLGMSIERRACEGIFIGFQHPVSIAGVANAQFLKMAVNSQREYRGQSEMDSSHFLDLTREKMRGLAISDGMLERPVNEGLSGGEKKKNEMLQIELLEPKLVILDELDSGLDIDAMKLVAKELNKMREAERSFLIITHYERFLDYLKPDRVHLLSGGTIFCSGSRELSAQIETQGFARLREGISRKALVTPETA